MLSQGQWATFRAMFEGGTGLLTPGDVEMTSGEAVDVGPLEEPAAFTLTVTNLAGDSVEAQVELDVVPPPSVASFAAESNPVLRGETATLIASFCDGCSGTIDQGIGAVASDQGVDSSAIEASTTFTLTVTNLAGDSVTAQVTVLPYDGDTCREIKDRDPEAPDGIYTLLAGDDLVEAYCDMTTDGGGWMLMLAYAHAAGSKPRPNGNALPTSPNAGASHRYLAAAGFTEMEGEVRFYCETAAHSRRVHFKTSNPNVVAAAFSGAQSWSVGDWTAGFTLLPDHTGNLPASATHVSSNPGGGFTDFPFYTAGTYHWGAAATGSSRWECDDAAGGPQHTTLHQVWFREGEPPPRSCSEILARDPGAADGIYTVVLDSETLDVECDMTFDGGGWTLAWSSGGAAAHPPVAPPRSGVASRLDLDGVIALASISEQAHIRTSGDAARSVTSRPGVTAIENLRAGLALSGSAEEYLATDWTGAMTASMPYHCVGQTGYPTVYHACGNGSGLHLLDNVSSWTNSTTESIELWLRDAPIPASCAELLGADPDAPEGEYVIDADGPGGAAPAYVTCLHCVLDPGGCDECALGVDDCAEDATCTDLPDGFECTCNAGYEGDGTGCTDVDECTLDTDDCHEHASCTNTPGSFSCACNSGYTGDGVDECRPLPIAPNLVVAAAGDGAAYVTFDEADPNGGPAIVEYIVTATGGIVATGDSSPIIVTGLGNATTYTFTVVARNEDGDASEPSAPSNGVTPSSEFPEGSYGALLGYTGAPQSFVVPLGIDALEVDLVGASGGHNYSDPNTGGAGGRVEATLLVSPGEILDVYVGGEGSPIYTPGRTTAGQGGWNGGGGLTTGANLVDWAGGGGATDIRQGGSELGDRVLVAAGGGGSLNAGGMSGGHGGGLAGGDGEYDSSGPGYGKAGKGGTQTAGGNGGCWHNGTDCGGAGGFGYGGLPGGTGSSAAGGGGGYYGGGGGTADSGGGGGSSYADPDVCENVVHTADHHRGAGRATILFTP